MKKTIFSMVLISFASTTFAMSYDPIHSEYSDGDSIAYCMGDELVVEGSSGAFGNCSCKDDRISCTFN